MKVYKVVLFCSLEFLMKQNKKKEENYENISATIKLNPANAAE